MAASSGRLAAARLLLEAYPEGATFRNLAGRAPLHVAVGDGELAAAHLLLRAAPEAALLPDNIGNMPLHSGAHLGDTWLLQHPLAVARRQKRAML